MTTFLIGMGSNIEPERHLYAAAGTIRERFPDAAFSSVYRSAAVDMDNAADFLNTCCLINTVMASTRLNAWLKQLEDAHGRDRSQGSWKPRTLDLDILMWGDEVVSDDLYRYAHVYVPAAELVELSSPADAAGELQSVPLRL
ncbi:MAG: 2-amino-4-hydroxy-6-hydroxymethyldihydropteridine diphosphokinase [Mariprofundaceae bacterium]|nr:2-amino-4-hydroxy-6-hydroxymethyldihydropteridine diphosphokinase [Mariprofundaceae bacterium]